MIFESLDPIEVRITNGRPHYFKARKGSISLESVNEDDSLDPVQGSPVVEDEEVIVITSSKTGKLWATPTETGTIMTEHPLVQV